LCAVASLGYGLGILPFGPSGWKWIGNVTVLGAIALTFLPERVLGRYRRGGSGSALPTHENKGPRAQNHPRGFQEAPPRAFFFFFVGPAYGNLAFHNPLL